MVEKSGHFLLNLVGSNPTPMFRHFGRGFSLEEDAFAGLEIAVTEYGTLIKSCFAHLGCKLTQRVPVGDHDLFVGQIEHATAPLQGEMPYIHTRNSGFSY